MSDVTRFIIYTVIHTSLAVIMLVYKADLKYFARASVNVVVVVVVSVCLCFFLLVHLSVY